MTAGTLLTGIQSLGYKDDTTTTPGYRPAYQLQINPMQVSPALTYATLNWEPGNGNPPDGATSGWVTNSNIENGNWWTSKITSGPGSQASPEPLSAIETMWPNATILAYGVSVGHLGGNNTTAITFDVNGIQFLCGKTDFSSIEPPPPFKAYTTKCVWEMPKPDAANIHDAFKTPQILVGCGTDQKVPTDCGKLYQVDTEAINSQSDQDVLNKLIASKKLVSSKDDQQITKSWVFQQNPACVVDTTTSSSSAPTSGTSTAVVVATSTSTSPSQIAEVSKASNLANTGSNTSALALGALILLGAGSAVLVGARRRRVSRQH